MQLSENLRLQLEQPSFPVVGHKSSSFGVICFVKNPSTGTVIARVPLATKQEVQEAIAAAQAAFPAWRALSVGKRAEIILRFRQLITENIDELIDMICTESGKTIEP